MILGFIIVIASVIVKIAPTLNHEKNRLFLPDYIKIKETEKVNSFTIKNNIVYMLKTSVNGKQEIMMIDTINGDLIKRTKILADQK